MLKDVVFVKALPENRLHVRFEDGVEGTVSLLEMVPFVGVFEPLGDPAFFAEVRVNVELGSIEWPNGADLDPDVLYAQVAGKPLPEFIKQ